MVNILSVLRDNKNGANDATLNGANLRPLHSTDDGTGKPQVRFFCEDAVVYIYIYIYFH